MSVCLALVCAGIAPLLAPLQAQEGHPLAGTWTGDWGAASNRNHLTFVMNWDGKAITGLINPGPNAFEITAVTVDYSNWNVHIDAEGKEGGKAVKVIADGQLEDLGSRHRTIAGSWSQGDAHGTFKLVRD